MIAVDTNVLVRLLVADDPQQTAAVRRLVARVEAEGAHIRVPSIVLCETAWVLRSVYRLSRAEIADALTQVVSGDLVDVESAAATDRALQAFRAGRADLSDFLIREIAMEAGAEAVATFDRVALGEEGFLEPDPAGWPDGLTLHEAEPAYRRRPRRVAGRQPQTADSRSSLPA